MRTTRVTPSLVAALSVVALAACGAETDSNAVDLGGPEIAAALATIEPSAIQHHIEVLAHDSMEGRAPGTRGFESSMLHVERTFVDLGLEPAGRSGTYRQPVPLQESKVVEDESSMSVHIGDQVTHLTYGTDFYLSPNPTDMSVGVESWPVAFVGFGVSAPDLGYDDYASVDVDGKVVVFISGAPAFLPSNERAYYSSGATKVAEAVARGAVGTLTMWAPDDPRLRWGVNYARSQRGSFAWLDANGNPNRGGLRVSGSLNHSAAQELFVASPKSREEVFADAAAGEAQGFDLTPRISVITTSEHRTVESYNVIGRLAGSDMSLVNEHVVYVAHIDHFGLGMSVGADRIYNGAHDNASGVSIVMEIARAYTSLPTPPRRSILFLIVTAEEWGLLGADYFVHNPTVRQTGLVASFSLDMPFLFHPLLDIVPYGAEHSSLGTSVATAAEHMGLGIGPDPIPEQVLFIRSDHYAFIRQGIPSLFLKSGFETGDDRDGHAINTAFRQERYHTPFDEVEQGFDYSSGADHARINFLTGYVVAQEDARPRWNRGDFFGELYGRR